MNLAAAVAVAVREFKLDKGYGFADYLLFLNGKAVGVCEAKLAGCPFANVEIQAKSYVDGLPAALEAPFKPMPFAYISTGEETRLHQPLRSRIRARARSSRSTGRRRFASGSPPIPSTPGSNGPGGSTPPLTTRSPPRYAPDFVPCRPSSCPACGPTRSRPSRTSRSPCSTTGPARSSRWRPGSGKTLLAVTALYRLIKFGGARRVLFLVDRANLGEQAEKEFQGFRTPDDNRKFTELYNVQRLTSNTIGSSSKVVISTIQRLYSMLKGEPDLDPEAEEHTPIDDGPTLPKEPLPVVYNKAIPPEFFDVIFIDECHRSHLLALAAGARVLRRATCSASPRRRRSTPTASSTRTSSWSTPTSAPWRTA